MKLVNNSYLADGTKLSSLKQTGEGLVYRGPYAYCAGDPVNAVDPDGEESFFAWPIKEFLSQPFISPAITRFVNAGLNIIGTIFLVSGDTRINDTSPVSTDDAELSIEAKDTLKRIIQIPDSGLRR